MVESLGTLNEIYFVNLNKSEQPQKLPFAKQISKANEVCTKLDYIIEQCKQNRVKIKECKDYKDFISRKVDLQTKERMSKFTILDHVAKQVYDQYNFIQKQTEHINSMYSDYNDLVEYRKVIEVTQELLEDEEFIELRSRLCSLSERSPRDSDPEESKGLLSKRISSLSDIHSDAHHDVDDGNVTMGRIVGTCMNTDLLRLKRLLFRATRGNALVLTKSEGDIETFDKKRIPKSVFIVMFQEGEGLRRKIDTVTNNFTKHNYHLPNKGLNKKLDKLNTKIEETRQMIVMTVVGIEKYLSS